MSNIFEIFKAIFLGIVEGITEWLPISSTGHMILVDKFLPLNASESFKEMFFVVIQLGAILAVLFIYFNKLNPFSSKKNTREKNRTFRLWFKVLFASIPAGIIGILFDDVMDTLFYNYIVVSIMLILYGVLFIYIENKNKFKTPRVCTLDSMPYKTAFIIGLFQVLALIPGTSRSGATIVGAMLIGTSRIVATEFTFFLAIPAMLGASLLKIIKFGFEFTGMETLILTVGTLTSFLVSILAIKFLIRYIKNNNFKPFGYYRIGLGSIILIYFIITSLIK